MILILKKKGLPAPDPVIEEPKKKLVLKKPGAASTVRSPTYDGPVSRGADKTFDSMFDAVYAKCGPNMLIPWLLMAGYAYYVLDKPILSDARFDRACSQLLEHWSVVDHRHKGLITPEALQIGSLFHLGEADYPAMTKGATRHLMKN